MTKATRPYSRKTHSNPNPPAKKTLLFPKNVFAIAQCADYNRQSYVDTISREHGISAEEVVRQYHEAFGGVDGFLEQARKERDENMRFRRESSTFVLGEGPRAGDRIDYTYLSSWGFYLRVYGFECLGPHGLVVFDFIDAHKTHMKAPPDMSIAVHSYNEPPKEVYSIQESFKIACVGDLANAFGNAGEQDIGKQAYVIMQGVMLHITFKSKVHKVQIPSIPVSLLVL